VVSGVKTLLDTGEYENNQTSHWNHEIAVLKRLRQDHTRNWEVRSVSV
jgi:hypothetical protein